MSGQAGGAYGLQAFKVNTGTKPVISQVYSFPLTLVGGSITSFDLKPLANNHRIQNVQGIFVDNSAGTIPLTVTTAAGQIFKIPAGYQGVMPIYLSPDNVITFAGTGTVNVTLLNFPTPAAVWNATTSGSVVTISGTVQVQDGLSEGYLATMVNGVMPSSGSIVGSAVGVSTALFALNAARQYMFIQSAYNIAGSAFHDLWVNFNGGVAGVGLIDCVRIIAGSFYETNVKVSTKAVTYFDALGGNNITAFQG